MKIICPHCKEEADIYIGYVNRAKRLGVPRYCSKKCSGLARKIYRSKSERKRIKQNYDKLYRDRGYVYIIKAMRFFYEYENNPEKFKAIRKKRKEKHTKYCQQPEYRIWKKEYDLKYHAKNKYGEFWESAILINELEKEYEYRESIRINQLYNKSTQKRKRKWQQELNNKNYLQRT